MKTKRLLNSISKVKAISFITLMVLMGGTMINSLRAQGFTHIWKGGTGNWGSTNWYAVHTTANGSATSGSTSLTLAVNTNIAVGDYVAGYGIAPGTTISSLINPSTTSYTLTVATTAAATQGAVYTCGGYTYTVDATKVTNTGTALSVTCATASVTTATGTLTKSSGTGDNTIAYTAITANEICTLSQATTAALSSLQISFYKSGSNNSSTPVATSLVLINTGTCTIQSGTAAVGRVFMGNTSATTQGELVIASGGSLTTSAPGNNTTTNANLLFMGGKITNNGTLNATATGYTTNGYCIRFENPSVVPTVSWGLFGSGTLNINNSATTGTSGGPVVFNNTNTPLNAPEIDLNNATYTNATTAASPSFIGFTVNSGANGIIGGTGLSINTGAVSSGLIAVNNYSANSASLTINSEVTLNLTQSSSATVGVIISSSTAGSTTTLTNKGTINITGTSSKAAIAFSNSTASSNAILKLDNQGTISTDMAISGTYTGVLHLSNGGTSNALQYNITNSGTMTLKTTSVATNTGYALYVGSTNATAVSITNTGTFEFYGTSSSTGVGTTTFNNNAGGTVNILNSTVDKVIFNNNSGATLDCKTNSMYSNSAASPAYVVTINSGSTVKTANAGGLSCVSGTPVINAGANYVFNGVAAQTTGVALTTANNLEISNSAGVTLSGATTVNGTLTLTNGKLTNGSNLTLANGANVIKTAGSLSAAPTFVTVVNLTYGGTFTTQIGTTTASSTNVTLSASNANISVGMPVSGTGIATGATVSAISGTTLTLSQNATAAGTNTLSFSYNTAQITGYELPTSSAILSSLTINNTAGVTLGATTTVNGTLTLTSGTLTTTPGLALGNGATIVKSSGSLSAAPTTYGTSVNLTYNGTATKGNEFPGTDIINTLTVNNTGGITLTDNRNIPNLTIANGSSLSINAGNQLTVGTSLTNNGTLNLLSTSSGTATILTPATIIGSGSASINQYFSQDASGTRNWYVSSPVSGTIPAGYTFFQYVEPGNNADLSVTNSSAYWQGLATGTAYTSGRGYIALPTSNGSNSLTFNGSLHSTGNNISVALTKLGTLKTGFNLIGNPYPAHYTVTKAQTDAANALNTIWYRTATWVVDNVTPSNSKYVYTFQTCLINGDGSIQGTPSGTTNIIPPMQAFWVRTNTDGSTFNFNGTLSHQSSNPMKAPSKKDISLPTARFQVSNGIINDEALIYFNTNASNGFDSYDALKMNNNSPSVPEIYTLADNQQITINGMNAIPYNSEISLGFTTGKAGSFSIAASQFSNFDAGTQIILNDNQTNTQWNLTDGSAYNFNSDITNSNTNRFSLVFKAPSISTGNINNDSESNSVLVYLNVNNLITINCKNGIFGQATVCVYNTLGQKLEERNLTSSISVFEKLFPAGVYVVSVSANGKRTTQKITIN